MKKILFVLLLSGNIISAGNIFTYKLKDNENLKGTYSAKMANGTTVHFALTQNTDSKDYFMTPFVLDSDHKTRKLDSFTDTDEFDILSYHSNGNTLTVTENDGQKGLYIIDFNLLTGKCTSARQRIVNPPDNVFRLEDKTLMVFFDKRSGIITIKSIADSGHVDESKITVPKENIKTVENLFGQQKPEAINQQEYVENGSISKNKGYYADNNLIYTMANEKDTEVIHIDMLGKTFSDVRIAPEFSKKTKDINSFFYNGKMTYSFVESTDLRISVFDASTGNVMKTFSVANDFKSSVTSEAITEYLKTASKMSIKSTITINKTKSGKMALHLGNVNENDYHYSYNWWYNDWFFMNMMMWQNQQMMMQQQMMHSVPHGFGPSPNDCIIALKEKKKYASVDICVDANLNASENEETAFKNIDKLHYNDKYSTEKYIKDFTSEFTDSELRYIYQDSKSKEIIIAFENL